MQDIEGQFSKSDVIASLRLIDLGPLCLHLRQELREAQEGRVIPAKPDFLDLEILEDLL